MLIDAPPVDQWQYFTEFARAELASGGPDPQLPTVDYLSKHCSVEERLWRVGCYIALHNVAYGEAIWQTLPWVVVNKWSPEKLQKWLVKNMYRIRTRVERRCVRRADWLAEFLVGYIQFVKRYPQLQQQIKGLTPVAAYCCVWDAATTVPRLGRYIAIKFLEFLQRFEGLPIEPPDIRPKGAWSPRLTLAGLWPDHIKISEENDSTEILNEVRAVCSATIQRLRDDYAINLSLFQLQVLLCEYREYWGSQRYYPGRSLDEELGYGLRAERDWSIKLELWEARLALFPRQHLGEHRGWDGNRKVLGETLAKYGYVWSDLKYDFKRTYSFLSPQLC